MIAGQDAGEAIERVDGNELVGLAEMSGLVGENGPSWPIDRNEPVDWTE
jgi:hypothetical protein